MSAPHHEGHVSAPSLLLRLLMTAFCSSLPAVAQFAPTSPNLTTVRSPINPDISISYTVPEGVCKTAIKDQQQYTGWVNLPGPYPTNLFFWFVGAREETESLTVWLNGGPGSSSLFGMFSGVGPCHVVEKGLEEYETLVNQWGWDRASNMLFIDQPNQVGFSYDSPTNGSINLLNGTKVALPEAVPADQSPYTFLNGTFSSLNKANMANTTEQAAMAVYHLMQGFLATFPEYNPPNNGSLGVNLFAESYGGKYGPVFADVWQKQNLRRLNDTTARHGTVEIHLTSLGIINGCIDDQVQSPYYPLFANHNTYGFKALSTVRANLANASMYAPNGCLELITLCRAGQRMYDPQGAGTVDSVNDDCRSAYETCNNDAISPYDDSGRSYYDIARILPDSFPPSTYLNYLNTLEVQQAIGAVTNFTALSDEVLSAFLETGEHERGPHVPRLAMLLASGVRVGLVYGDRDYICNWMGGEAAANAIAAELPDVYGTRYTEDAGYAPIIVNDSYIGGVVRQYGNLSFSRIYQAGHSIPAYQPETAFQVFARIIMGTSVSTGDAIDLIDFVTEGDDRADEHEDDLPDSPAPTCWIRDVRGTCDSNQQQMLRDGTGVVINGVLYAESSDWPLATRIGLGADTMSTSAVEASGTSGVPVEHLTGVFTATSTPEGSTSNLQARPFWIVAGCMGSWAILLLVL